MNTAKKIDMITIQFNGEMADYFIPEFQCEARSPWEALQAIKANFENFIGYLRDSGARGIGFHIKVDYQTLSQEQISSGFQFGKKVKRMIITPVPVGSGGGFFRVILGVALIGLAFTGVGFLGLSPLTLGLLGGSMLLSGISQMFGKTDSPNKSEKDGKRSLIFGNPETTVREGGRIPIIMGKHLVGGYVVSARVRSYKI